MRRIIDIIYEGKIDLIRRTGRYPTHLLLSRETHTQLSLELEYRSLENNFLSDLKEYMGMKIVIVLEIPRDKFLIQFGIEM